MISKEYVGITGPVNVQETRDICREFSEARYNMDSPHIPMLGFLVSYKTLNGQEVKNRRYPSVTDISDLLRATDGQVLTMIHYNSNKRDTLAIQVDKIFDGIYDLCKAIQLNIVWPNVEQVAKIKQKYSDMQIVFQASNKIIEEKPNEIAQKVKDYENLVNYVLIDPSGGRGLPFDLDFSAEIYLELREKCPDLTIGFAGGFNGENAAPRLENIIQRIGANNFCIDAEGGLRDKLTDEYGDDILNIEKVRSYLQSVSSILK